MKKKLSTIVLLFLLLLSGCQPIKETAGNILEKVEGYAEKPEAEMLEFVETSFNSADNLASQDQEFSSVRKYILPGISEGRLYQWPKEGEQKHYSVMTFYDVGYSVEMQMQEELAAQCAMAEDAVVLSNEEDTCRLYVTPLNPASVTGEQIADSIKQDWIRNQGHNLVYQGGFYAKEKTAEGWQITIEVENINWHGYAVKWFDFAGQKAYEFIYVENKGIYNGSQAMEFVQGIRPVQPEIAQVVFEKTIELREFQKHEYFVADYFEGNPYGLALLSQKPSKKPLRGNSTGSETLVYEYAGTEYLIDLEVVDTLAPEISFVGDMEQMLYFMQDMRIEVHALARMFFTTSDESGLVDITLPDGSKSLKFTREEFSGEQSTGVLLSVTDRYGNSCEVTIPVALVSEDRIPEWYSVFFNGNWDKVAVDALDDLICDMECDTKDYLTRLYAGRYLNVFISAEMAENAVKAVEKLAAEGLNIEFSSGMDIGNIMIIYLNLVNIPTELLMEYAENGVIKIENLTPAVIMNNFQKIVITEEMKADILTGKQLAEELGIAYEEKIIAYILTVAADYAALAGSSEAALQFYKEYVDFCYDSEISGLDFVKEIMEDERAVQGYLQMKDSGIRITLPEKMDPEQLLLWFECVTVFPEEIVSFCKKQDMEWYMDLTDMYQLANNTEDISAAMKTLESLKKIGVKMKYPKQMTKSFISACSCLSYVPEGILRLCADQGFSIQEDEWEEHNRTLYWSYAEEAEKGYQLAQKAGLKIVATEEYELWQVVLLHRNLAELPEDFLKVCAECDAAVHFDKPGSVANREAEYEQALQGYQMLKDKGIELTNSGAYVYMIHDFLCGVLNAPEEYLLLLEEADISLDICNEWRVFDNIQESAVLIKEAYASWKEMKDLKLDITYDDEVSMREVLAFYQIMDDIPEEILKQYVKNDWEIEVECIDDWGYGTNHWVQDAITQELYDRALSGYKKVKKYGIEVKVQDVWEPIKLVSFYAGLDFVDEDALELFENLDWKIILSDLSAEELKKKYDLSLTPAGLTVYGDDLIEVIEESSVDYIDDTIIHEMGHFIDSKFGKGDEICSASSEFISMFKKYKKKENGGNDERGFVEDVLHDIETICYREYAFTNEGEFFAESYEMYCAYPKEFKEKYPDVYQYIKECID